MKIATWMATEPYVRLEPAPQFDYRTEVRTPLRSYTADAVVPLCCADGASSPDEIDSQEGSIRS
jgi:hypothetical protein